MTVKSEWKLLEKIDRHITARGGIFPSDLTVPIGDDCAVFKNGKDSYGLITTDISIENTHFSLKIATPEDIGYKAMTGNLSDIAAMGGSPRYAVVSLGIPLSGKASKENFILALYTGMIEAANKTGCSICGGDVSRSETLIINITLYGSLEKEKPLTRDGAKPGDHIYLTGTTGDSQAGLEIFQTRSNVLGNRFSSLKKKHLRPEHRLGLIAYIRKTYSPTAMIDISDGLISDLGHIAENSRVGYELNRDALPLSEELQKYTRLFEKDSYSYVLGSGEEYELLFTTSKKKLPDNTIYEDIPITRIGTVLDKGRYLVIKGKREKVSPSGYDHFALKE